MDLDGVDLPMQMHLWSLTYFFHSRNLEDITCIFYRPVEAILGQPPKSLPKKSSWKNEEWKLYKAAFLWLLVITSKPPSPRDQVEEIKCTISWRKKKTLGGRKWAHPWKLTWNIIMEVRKIVFFGKWVIFSFHVNFPGCKDSCRCSWAGDVIFGKMIPFRKMREGKKLRCQGKILGQKNDANEMAPNPHKWNKLRNNEGNQSWSWVSNSVLASHGAYTPGGKPNYHQVFVDWVEKHYPCRPFGCSWKNRACHESHRKTQPQNVVGSTAVDSTSKKVPTKSTDVDLG